MNLILSAFVVCLMPLVIMKLEKHLKLIEWLSPVVCCYAFGIFLGNLPGVSWNGEFAKTLSEVSVMLAIPLLLFATDFLGWLKLAKTTILSFVILIFCVTLVSILGGYLFRAYDPEIWKMAGMITGVYIGGTANLTAIGKMLEIRNDAFITLNAVDVALGGVYLLLIMSIGVKILTKFLRPFNFELADEVEADLLNWKKLSSSKKFQHVLILILLCVSLIGVSLLLSKLLTGGESAGVIILILTGMAIGLSFIPKIRHFEGSQESGHYFLLIFCVAVGSLANAEEVLTGKMWYFLFCSFILFGSIALHFICCFFLKIDRDTAIITSMAGIFGPAFIAPMSDVLKNRAILVSGITCGLVGIAVGNFIGLFVAWILKQ